MTRLPRLRRSEPRFEADSISSNLIKEGISFDVFPFRSSVVQVTLSDSDPFITRIVIDALHKDADSLYEAVQMFFLECAQRLVYEQQPVYEIVVRSIPERAHGYHWHEPLFGPVRSLHISGLPHRNLEIRSGTLYEKGRQGLNPQPDRKLDPSRYLILDCPQIRNASIEQLCNEIAQIENHASELHLSAVRKSTENLVKGRQSEESYNYDLEKRNTDYALLFKARELGWNFPNTVESRITTYYTAVRHLRWKRLVATVREVILHGVNDALKIGGSQLGFSTQLSISGLPSPHDADEAMVLLEKGIPIFEALKPFTY